MGTMNSGAVPFGTSGAGSVHNSKITEVYLLAGLANDTAVVGTINFKSV